MYKKIILILFVASISGCGHVKARKLYRRAWQDGYNVGMRDGDFIGHQRGVLKATDIFFDQLNKEGTHEPN